MWRGAKSGLTPSETPYATLLHTSVTQWHLCLLEPSHWYSGKWDVDHRYRTYTILDLQANVISDHDNKYIKFSQETLWALWSSAGGKHTDWYYNSSMFKFDCSNVTITISVLWKWQEDKCHWLWILKINAVINYMLNYDSFNFQFFGLPKAGMWIISACSCATWLHDTVITVSESQLNAHN